MSALAYLHAKQARTDVLRGLPVKYPIWPLFDKRATAMHSKHRQLQCDEGEARIARPWLWVLMKIRAEHIQPVPNYFVFAALWHAFLGSIAEARLPRGVVFSGSCVTACLFLQQGDRKVLRKLAGIGKDILDSKNVVARAALVASSGNPALAEIVHRFLGPVVSYAELRLSLHSMDIFGAPPHHWSHHVHGADVLMPASVGRAADARPEIPPASDDESESDGEVEVDPLSWDQDGFGPYARSDIDIFISANTLEDADSIVKNTCEAIRHVEPRATMVGTPNTITFARSWPERHVQVVTLVCKHPSHHALFADLDSTSFLCMGGMPMASERSMDSFVSQNNFVPFQMVLERRDEACRIGRYVKRGFSATVVLDVNRPRPTGQDLKKAVHDLREEIAFPGRRMLDASCVRDPKRPDDLAEYLASVTRWVEHRQCYSHCYSQFNLPRMVDLTSSDIKDFLKQLQKMNTADTRLAACLLDEASNFPSCQWKLEKTKEETWSYWGMTEDMTEGLLSRTPNSDGHLDDKQECTHVIQLVQHPASDPAAEIHPSEAQRMQDELWASAIEMRPVAVAPRTMLLLTFDHYTRILEHALLESPLASGATWPVNPEWAGGAKLFVDVEPRALRAMLPPQHIFKPWHVLLRGEDEDALHAAIEHLPEGNRKIKAETGRMELYYREAASMQADADPEDIVRHMVTEFPVRRGFIDFSRSNDHRSTRSD